MFRSRVFYSPFCLGHSAVSLLGQGTGYPQLKGTVVHFGSWLLRFQSELSWHQDRIFVAEGVAEQSYSVHGGWENRAEVQCQGRMGKGPYGAAKAMAP